MGIGPNPPKPRSQYKRDLLASDGLRAGNNKQRDRGHGEGGRNNRDEAGCLFHGDKGLPLDREDTDMDHRTMAVSKGERGNPVLG